MAFSRAPPPTRGQQNLLGFMQMSSGRRFSLEQLMPESGRLEPEQTLNHRAWGPLSVLSASRKDVLAAQIGEIDDLTTYEMGMLHNRRWPWQRMATTGPRSTSAPRRPGASPTRTGSSEPSSACIIQRSNVKNSSKKY